MESPTTFTAHAFFRVRQRLNLSHAEIAGLFDAGAMVPLGKEERSNRMRLLFYSPRDDACFVAVRDAANGEVVTIMPAEYLRRSVTEEMLHLAKQRALAANLVSTSHTPDRTDPDAGLPTYEVLVHMQDDVGRPRLISIGRVRAAKMTHALRRIASDSKLHEDLLRERDACIARERGSASHCFLQRMGGPRHNRGFIPIDLEHPDSSLVSFMEGQEA